MSSLSPSSNRLPNRLLLLAAIVLFISVAASPFIVFRPDYRDYWLPWQSHTIHFRPWDAYTLENCNYPPVVLYLLATVDLARHLLHVPYKSPINIALMKLPNIAAHLLGALALYRTFASRRPRVAAGLAAAWLLSLNLFVNSALWGQWDVILATTLLLALLDLRREKYLLCGIWLGVAMATKVQTVFVLPVIGVFLLSLFDWRPILKMASGAALSVFVIFAPMAIAGQLPKSLEVYRESVGTFRFRTIDAWNIWAIANTVEGQFLGGERAVIMKDTRPFLGWSEHFTHRDVGLILFGTYTVAVLITVFRRRSVADVLLAAPVLGVAMYMLATQMHERYIGPPAALMIFWLLLPTPYRIQFAYWTAMAAVSQFFVLIRSNPYGVQDWQYRPGTIAFAYTALCVSTVNLVMFCWLTWLYFRPRFDPSALLDVSTAPRGFDVTPSQNSAA